MIISRQQRRDNDIQLTLEKLHDAKKSLITLTSVALGFLFYALTEVFFDAH